MPWIIKMVDPTTPELHGPKGETARAVDDPSAVVVSGGRTLDELTPREAADEGWFSFLDVQPNDNLYDYGVPAYATVGYQVTRTFPNAVFKVVSEIRRYKMRQIRGHYNENGRTLSHGGDEFVSDNERAGVVGLLMHGTRDVGFAVEMTNGDSRQMTDTEFRAYGTAMASQSERLEIRFEALRKMVQDAADAPTIVAIDHLTGW